MKYSISSIHIFMDLQANLERFGDHNSQNKMKKDEKSFIPMI